MAAGDVIARSVHIRAHINIGGRRLGSGTLDAKASDDRLTRGLLIAQIY
jgi:hypothetical protein